LLCVPHTTPPHPASSRHRRRTWNPSSSSSSAIIISPDTPCLHVQYQYSTLCHHFPPAPASIHTPAIDLAFFLHLRPSPSNNSKTFSSLDEKGYQRGRAAGWGSHTRPRGLQGLLLRACVIDRPLFHPIDCCAWGGYNTNISFLCV
jgi:hypothetical protein